MRSAIFALCEDRRAFFRLISAAHLCREDHWLGRFIRRLSSTDQASMSANPYALSEIRWQAGPPAVSP
jgi:hypothetical protein